MAVLIAASQGQKTHAMYHNLVLYAPEIWTMSKAFKTTEVKMPDIVGLSSILTQKNDLKFSGGQPPCSFDPRPRHLKNRRVSGKRESRARGRGDSPSEIQFEILSARTGVALGASVAVDVGDGCNGDRQDSRPSVGCFRCEAAKAHGGAIAAPPCDSFSIEAACESDRIRAPSR